MTSTVTPGFCVGTCSNVYIYMALLAIIKLIVSFSAVGNLIIDLRYSSIPYTVFTFIGTLTITHHFSGAWKKETRL